MRESISMDAAVDLHGSRDGLAVLIEGGNSFDSWKWLDHVTARCVRGDELCTAQPFLVQPLLELAVRDGARARSARRAIDTVYRLADLADDVRLSPTSGRVGRGPTGAGHIQALIRAEIQSATPLLRILFDKLGGTGRDASRLAAIATFGGAERLPADAALQRELLRCEPGEEAHNLGLVLSSVEVDGSWQDWLTSVVGSYSERAVLSARDAVAGLASWCLLVQSGYSLQDGVTEGLWQLLVDASINHQRIWSRFHAETSMKARLEHIRYCRFGPFAVEIAVELLLAAFEPHMVMMGWSSREGEICYRLSGQPSAVEPSSLREDQRRVLSAIGSSPAMYRVKTNVWRVWGLPDSADEMRGWLAANLAK